MVAIPTDIPLGANLAPVGLTRNESHEYWFNGKGPIPSVTTILKVYDKSGPLVGWAKREVSAAAVRNLPALVSMVEQSGQEPAAAWLRTIPGYQRDTAANIGTTVHHIADQLARGEHPPVPEDVAPYVAAYQRWVAEWQPVHVASEEMVVSLRHDYAGTFDAIVDMAGERWFLDIKTSKGTYAETALQLVAYSCADFIGRPGDPRTYGIPKVDRYGVLHLRPEGYEVVPYAVDEATWRAFLAAKALHAWSTGQGATVMGAPVRRVG